MSRAEVSPAGTGDEARAAVEGPLSGPPARSVARTGRTGRTGETERTALTDEVRLGSHAPGAPERDVADDVGPVTGAANARPPRLGFGSLLRSELALVLGRRRNQLLLALLTLVPVLLGVVLAITRDSAYGGQGPGFIDRVSGNGLFLVVTALFLCLPLLLPLGVSIAAADAIAGEASTGTLRYLLLVPVGRGRLLAAKAVAAFGLVIVGIAGVTAAALITGWVLFGYSELDLLSGQTIGVGAGFARMLGVAGYVALSLTGLLAVGLFYSTLTEVPIGVIAATVVTSIVSTVLDSLPQLAVIHPYLLTHHWFDFAEFLRFEPSWPLLGQGLLVQLAWVAVFGSLAWARFTPADITS